MKAAFFLLARLLLGGVFVYAAWTKLPGTSERFAITVAQFTFVPQPLIMILAALLPWLEAATGVLILVPRTTRLGAALAACLLAVFLAALSWAWSQHLMVDCGCFGEDQPAAGNRIPAAILRDVVLLALTLPLALRPRRR